MRLDLDRIVESPHKTVRRQVVGTMTVPDAESRLSWAGEVDDGLARMLPDERAFIRASYADGMPHSFIASQAGLSEVSVSRAIASGMRKLAAGLESSYRAETPPDIRGRITACPNVFRRGRRHPARFDQITIVDTAGF